MGINTFKYQKVTQNLKKITLVLYIKDRKNKARFVLSNGQISENTLWAIGINPSVASDTQSDPTWTRVQKMATYQNFDTVVLINVYPQRATYIKDLPAHRPYFPLHRANLQEIQKLVEPLNSPKIWAAWGNLIEARPYLPKCLLDVYEILQKKSPQWFKVGEFTSKGHPKHPLARGKKAFRYEENFQEFDMYKYLENFI